MPSRVDSLKLRIPLPIPRPISGRRFAPKIMMRMMISSGKPRLPILRAPCSFRGELANSITVTGIACCLSVVALKPAVVAGVGAGQFTSGVNLVEVYASVTDGQGTPVTGLKQADFE